MVERLAIVTSKVSTTGSSTAALGGSASQSTSSYVYCVAGFTTGGVNNAYYASLSSSGVSSWTSTTAYPVSNFYHACVTTSNDIYCIGGLSSPSTAYYSAVGVNGIGTWTSTTGYPGGYDYGSCVTDGSYVYCLRGLYTNGVSYAQLTGSGIGSWTSTNTYPLSILYYDPQSCAISAGYIYCIGGFDGATNHVEAYYAPVYGAGGVGTWSSTTSYPIGLGGISCNIKGGYIYCVGGTGATSYSSVYYATVSSSGIGSWIASNSYPTNTAANSCNIKGGYIYCGVDGTTNFYYAPVLNPGIGSWTSTNSYPIASELTQCITN